MKKEFNKDKIADLIRQLLMEFGDDTTRQGLIDTPKRVAEMYIEMLQGMLYTNQQIAQMFDKTFECNTRDLVLVKDIECFSFCEHHMALIYNMHIHIGYIPNGKIIGLSKIVRIADMVCKRLQLQERIGSDIASIISTICNTQDVIVVIEASHSCMTARGIKNAMAKTKTAAIRGIFENDHPLRQEVYNLISK